MKESSKSELLYEKSRKLMPGGVNSPVRAYAPFPIFPGYAKGKIFDVDGNEYVDYCLGYGPLILGHSHPNVVAAVREGHKEIMEMIARAGGVYQAGTFSGNPISVVAGLATFEYIK